MDISDSIPPYAEPPDLQTASRIRAAHRRMWWICGLLVVVPAVLLLLCGGGVAVWFGVRQRTATQDVLAEAERIRAAGEPITADDLYAYHVVPGDVIDITPLWIAALDSFDEKQLSADGARVPIFGQEIFGEREVTHDEATLVATEDFLRKYEPTIELALKAAAAQGECRFPVEFEDGIDALLPYPQKMRSVTRLFALRTRVSKARGDHAKAIESIEAIFAAARSQRHQLTIVEQLVAMAIGGLGYIETERLLNETELSEEELARLSAAVSSVKPEEGLTRAMLGERAMIFHGFYHLGQLTGSDDPAKFPGEGQLTLPVDCRYYLDIMGQTIEASRMTYPDALGAAEQVHARMTADMKEPLARFTYTVTLLMAPAMNAAFEATARNVARRDTTLCALAAERFRRAHGRMPQKLDELVPEFLPGVPTDPFDGQPLRLNADAGELRFYSVAKDRKDDGGVEKDNRAEPDIVVKLRNN